MPDPIDSIAPDVVDAFRRGDMIGAIKLMRSKGMGLQEARAILDTIKRTAMTPPGPKAPANPPPVARADWPSRGNAPPLVKVPPGRAGQPVQDAGEENAAAKQPRKARSDGLAPGEVPPDRIGPWVVAILALAALAAYMLGGR